MVARRPGQPGGVRKVRAPQRRVAGNARPPRGEDQCHSDDAGFGAGVKRGKLYPEQGQIGGRNPCGATRRGRGALPSPRVGRMSRRVTGGLRWMAIRRDASRGDRTRLTDRLADTSTSPRRRDPRHRSDPRDRQRGGARVHDTAACGSACWSRSFAGSRSLSALRSDRRETGRLVLVGAERVRRRAGVADRRGRLEVAEGDRHAAVRQQALDVVQPARRRSRPGSGAGTCSA